MTGTKQNVQISEKKPVCPYRALLQPASTQCDPV